MSFLPYLNYQIHNIRDEYTESNNALPLGVRLPGPIQLMNWRWFHIIHFASHKVLTLLTASTSSGVVVVWSGWGWHLARRGLWGKGGLLVLDRVIDLVRWVHHLLGWPLAVGRRDSRR